MIRIMQLMLYLLTCKGITFGQYGEMKTYERSSAQLTVDIPGKAFMKIQMQSLEHIR